MNIEDERKAFSESAACGFCQYSTFEEDYFKVWLAAKAHAAEESKPKVEIVWKPVWNAWATFEVTAISELAISTGHLFSTKEAAITWAESKGYKVVEE